MCNIIHSVLGLANFSDAKGGIIRSSIEPKHDFGGPLRRAIRHHRECRLNSPQQFTKDMVSDHQDDIKAFEQQATKSGPAADFAKQSLPTLRQHLQMAQDLQNQSQTTGSK